MRIFTFFLLVSTALFSCSFENNKGSNKDLPTPVFLSSDSVKSPTYQENISFWKKLSSYSKQVKIWEIGESDAGKPIHLVTWSYSKIKDLKSVRERSERVLFINNGIHPGEPDGIDACQLMLLEILKSQEKQNQYKDCIIALIPVYNIGGVLNRNSHSRANQEGPESYGFRGNAQNLDLNRDCIKMDAKNSRALASVFTMLDPDLFFDTHVSNGADYQHIITLLETQNQKLSGPLESVYREVITAGLFKKMADKGYEMIPYVNVWGRSPAEGGIEQFMDWPRYTNGLATLHHVPGFTIETHMLKAFKDRVIATKKLLESGLEILVEYGTQIAEAKIQQADYYAGLSEHFYHWELDKTRLDSVEFSGYSYETMKSAVGDFTFKGYNKNKAFSSKIPYYNYYTANKSFKKPQYFVIPAGYHDLVDKLAAQGVVISKCDSLFNKVGRVLHIVDYKTSPQAYEKHYPHYAVEFESRAELVTVNPGDFLIKTGGPMDRFLMETLIPDATDSYFTWNEFDAILQQKEGFSPYVWDAKAGEILNTDTELKESFDSLISTDAEFSNNYYAQLDWIYKHSEFYEKAHLRYPVLFLD